MGLKNQSLAIDISPYRKGVFFFHICMSSVPVRGQRLETVHGGSDFELQAFDLSELLCLGHNHLVFFIYNLLLSL